MGETPNIGAQEALWRWFHRLDPSVLDYPIPDTRQVLVMADKVNASKSEADDPGTHELRNFERTAQVVRRLVWRGPKRGGPVQSIARVMTVEHHVIEWHIRRHQAGKGERELPSNAGAACGNVTVWG